MLRAKASQPLLDQIQAGEIEAMVVFDARRIQDLADSNRRNRGLLFEDRSIREFKKTEFRKLKGAAWAALQGRGVRVLHDYENLPMAYVRLESAAGLRALLERPEVSYVQEIRYYETMLSESLRKRLSRSSRSR